MNKDIKPAPQSAREVAEKCHLIAQAPFVIDTILDLISDNIGSYAESRVSTAEARIKELEEALTEISTTFPSALFLNGDAMGNDPDYIKLSNNHMAYARAALKGKE